MRTDQHVVERHQPMIVRRRFVIPHVQPRTGDLLGRQRIGQRIFIMDAATRGGDKIRVRLHQREFTRTHQIVRLFRVGAVDRHIVGLPQQIVQLLDLLRTLRRDLRGTKIRVVGQHAHAEQTLAQLRQPAADIADANDTDRLVQQLRADERIAGNIRRATHPAVDLDDPLRQRQQHRQRVLGHRLLVPA